MTCEKIDLAILLAHGVCAEFCAKLLQLDARTIFSISTMVTIKVHVRIVAAQLCTLPVIFRVLPQKMFKIKKENSFV